MLVEFTVGNFRSFRDRATLSLVATHLRAKDKRVDEENVVLIANDFGVLKGAAIYGPNAGGKTNLVLALRFMKRLALGSARESQAGEPIDVESFALSTETVGRPSYFEVTFAGSDYQYRYGFEVSAERIEREWLHHVPKVKEARLFEREGDRITVSQGFHEGKGLEGRTRPNALFLSVAAQFNGEVSRRVLEQFRSVNVVSAVGATKSRSYSVRRFQDPERSAGMLRFVRDLDLDIQGIECSKEAVDAEVGLDAWVVHTTHQRFDGEGRPAGTVRFDLDRQESHGTRKLFELSGPITDTLERGWTLIVDEMDARLHPLLTRAIIRLFQSPGTNPHGAQLVFTTHDTDLLDRDLFRRDQIWFAEKDRQGASSLVSLAEYRVKNEASFESDYLKGRYRGIPHPGPLVAPATDEG